MFLTRLWNIIEICKWSIIGDDNCQQTLQGSKFHTTVIIWEHICDELKRSIQLYYTQPCTFCWWKMYMNTYEWNRNKPRYTSTALCHNAKLFYMTQLLSTTIFQNEATQYFPSTCLTFVEWHRIQHCVWTKWSQVSMSQCVEHLKRGDQWACDPM